MLCCAVALGRLSSLSCCWWCRGGQAQAGRKRIPGAPGTALCPARHHTMTPLKCARGEFHDYQTHIQKLNSPAQNASVEFKAIA